MDDDASRRITPADKFFLNSKEVCALVSLSRTQVWRLEARGDFPARRQLSSGRVAWLRAEVEEWARNLPTAGEAA